jgi:iron-sulfur cluster assembly protein
MDKKNNLIDADIIILTDNAAKRVNAILTGEKKEGYFLRVSVVGGGCSGMSYNLSFDNQEKEFDKIYESNGIKVVCDVKSWFYVKGTEIDFSDDLLSGGFKLNNPNANRTCGCGTSFSA